MIHEDDHEDDDHLHDDDNDYDDDDGDLNELIRSACCQSCHPYHQTSDY